MDSFGRRRIAEYDERLTRNMAEHVQAADRKKSYEATQNAADRDELGVPQEPSVRTKREVLG